MYFLMSIKPQFARMIMRGEKTVEIRRTKINAFPGDTILVYSTLPEAKIIGYFEIQQVVSASVEDIWNDYGEQTGLTYEAYLEYSNSKAEMCAIVIASTTAVEGKKLNDMLRRVPQSYVRITEEEFQALAAGK